jgi:hypothetical protein
MRDEIQNNNLLFEKNKKDNSHDTYSQSKSYILTEINNYNNKSFSKTKNILIPTKLINNRFDNYNSKNCKTLNIKFIKSLITKPEAIPFDGYLCKRKKPTINYLLNKTKVKENKKLLEENILFKCPYPLIKYLSNRKVKNKSRQLITDILRAKFNDLSIKQKKEMQYKPTKSLIKLSKNKYPKINNLSQNKTYNNSKIDESFTLSTSKIKNQFIKIKNKHYVKKLNLNSFLNNYSTDNKLSDESRKLIIYNIKKLRTYNNNIKYKEHKAITNNISFLRETETQKYENVTMNHILKDISLLKFNNHIMPINY